MPASRDGCQMGLGSLTYGGLRTLACHLLSMTSLPEMAKIAGQTLFASGPHGEKPNWNDRVRFGHYNRPFVQWIVDHGIPGATDAAFRDATQPSFDKFAKGPVSAYLFVLYKIQSSPTTLPAAKAKYEKLMKQPGGLVSPFIEFYPFVEGNPDYLYKDPLAFAFWIRRHLDNTADLFQLALEKLANVYSPGLVAELKVKAGNAPVAAAPPKPATASAPAATNRAPASKGKSPGALKFKLKRN